MAKKARDAAEHDGPLSPHTLRIDVGLMLLFRELGEGDAALGAREAGRIAKRVLYDDGRLTRPVLERMERTHPAEARAYYNEYAEQVLTPHRYTSQKPATWRENQAEMRRVKRESMAAIQNSPYFPLAPKPTNE